MRSGAIFQSRDNLKAPCGQQGWHTQQEGEFGGDRPTEADDHGGKNASAGPAGAGESRREQLSTRDCDGNCPRNPVSELPAPQPPFDEQNKDATDQAGPSNRRRFFGKAKMKLLQSEPANGCDQEGDRNFRQVVLVDGIAPAGHQISNAFCKYRENGQDGP